MKILSNRLLLVLIAMLLLVNPTVYAQYDIPVNLSQVKLALEKYHDSGRYQSDIEKTIRCALYYLKFRINQNHQLKKPRKLAIVLDIDETSLSNYADMKKLDFGGQNDEITKLEMQGNDPAISSTLKLYHYAQKNQVAVFFITGRKEKMRQITINNLKSVGFNQWQKLYMKPNNYHGNSVAPYKIAMRKKIIAAGYDIVLNIGDQASDLKGGLADMSFKLPNPYYCIQ